MSANWLFVVRGKDQGRRFEITRSRKITIGREKSNLIRLIDDEASRAHAEIVLTDDGINIRDLGSSNGTFVNGERISSQALKRGDQIDIGKTSLLVSHSPPAKRETIPAGSSGSKLSENNSDSSENLTPILDSETLVGSVKSDLRFMYHAAMATSHASEVDQMLEEILNLVFDWLDVERGCILLWNAELKKYEPRATRYRTNESKFIKLKISKSIIKYVVESKEGILTADAGIDERLDGQGSIKTSGVKEAICVPIVGRSFIHGFIYADTTAKISTDPTAPENRSLNEDHLKLMVAIGHQVAVFIENTEYYSALVESERLTAVGQTLATLSHHVKNILQSINGGTHLIEDGLGKNDVNVIKQGWSIVKRNQRNMSNLVMDMVSFSKPNLPHLKPNNLNRTIENAIRGAVETSGKSNVKIHWEPNAELEKLLYDDALLNRAIENVFNHILDNCRSNTAGEIFVEALIENREANKQFVSIEIKDNFQALSNARIDAIFEPFAFEDENEVHGIGLAVTRKILNEHNGDIEVTRRRTKGLRFRLLFPCPTSAGGHPTGVLPADQVRGETDTI